MTFQPEHVRDDFASLRLMAVALGLAVLAPIAAAGGGMALVPLLGFAAILAGRWRTIFRGLQAKPWLLVLGLALVWCFVASLWSPTAGRMQALKTALLVCAGLVLCHAVWTATAKDRLRFGLIMAGGAAFLVALLSFEAVTGMSLNRLAQPNAIDWVLARNPAKGVSMLLVFGWAGAGVLVMQRTVTAQTLSVCLIVAMGIISLQFNMSANVLAFACGLAAATIGLVAPRWAVLGVASLWALTILLAPWFHGVVASIALPSGVEISWAARQEIWASAVARIEAQWLFGAGMDTARTMTAPYLSDGKTYAPLQLHPHSFGLQIWLELGAVGAALFAATAALAGWSGRTLPKPVAVAAGATAGAVFPLAFLSYGAWQEWWLAAIALSCVAAAGLRPDEARMAAPVASPASAR
jgi:O-antigen ligase